MSVLKGLTILEMAGIGPCPMAGMMLADMGANVIRIERHSNRHPLQERDASYRGKKSIVVDLKTDGGKDVFMRLVNQADAIIEGFRPGVMERLCIGPEECLAQNPRIVFGRVTGWGQDGPLCQAAGHDINFLGITGALFGCGESGRRPMPPMNLLGDMGGGGMLLVVGILAALLEAQRSGKGQVVDCAMVDGVTQMLWMIHGFKASGDWRSDDRGVNFLDGGAHFYRTYETSDNKYIAVGSVEPQFYSELLSRIGLQEEEFLPQMDSGCWSDFASRFEAAFRSRTQAEWCEILENTDACFSPVLSMDEAPAHAHNVARKSYFELDDFIQAAPAPRFSRTRSRVRHGARRPGADTVALLRDLGLEPASIRELEQAGAVYQYIADEAD